MLFLIEVKDLWFKYGNGWVLHGTNFAINKGDFLGIIGPNGSGKSTLLKLMDRIIQPQRGRILFEGKKIESFKRKELAQRIALLPQETTFYFDFKALEIVLQSRAPHLGSLRLEGQHDIAIAMDSMKKTDTFHLAYRSINTLSGGQKQGVLLARALAQEPHLLLLDEPTANLDIKHRMQIMNMLRRFNKKEGLTIVMASHDIDISVEYCSNIILLKNGEIFAKGSPHEVITKENILEVFEYETFIDKSPVSGKPRINLISNQN
jgi:iron complex transport system ATP-binding protein